MPQAEIQALNQKIDNSAFERAQQIQRDAPPWQSDAVLCGPFNPKAAPPTQIHQGSVARWRRHKLHVQRRKQGLPAESGAVQAVVLPSKELRNIAAALVSKLRDGMFYADFYAAWMLDFPPDQLDQSGTDVLNSATWAHVQRDGNRARLAHLRAHAISQIQALRWRTLRNGGWWPAPRQIVVQVHVPSQLLSAQFNFEPHFIHAGRICISWPT